MTEAVGVLQRWLESLYGIELGIDAKDYLLNSQDFNLLTGQNMSQAPEQLFVSGNAEYPEIGLYIAPSVLTTLNLDPPHKRLHTKNFAAFCIALEGVSHFALVCERAKRARHVSQLELEHQAEIDKFMTAWLWLQVQGYGLKQSAPVLRRVLYERYALRPELSIEVQNRYHLATQSAARTCQKWVLRYAEGTSLGPLLKEVRGHYQGDWTLKWGNY